MDDKKEKKEDDDYEEDMEGIRIYEEEMQDSLVVEEGMLVKFPLVLLATCPCPPSLAAHAQRLFLSRRSYKKKTYRQTSTNFGITVAMCLSARVVAKSAKLTTTTNTRRL